MKTQWIDIQCEGKVCQGYLSLPPAGSGPGLVLIQEIFGVNQHIRAVADQYAADGYVVLAPDVFFRQQNKVDLGYDEIGFQDGFKLMQAHDFFQSVRDLAVVVKTLRTRPEVDAKVASIGYCMGGLLSYLMAAEAGVDAAVCYYGGAIAQHLDKKDKIKVPMLFHFAGNDSYIPSGDVEQIQAAFASHNNTFGHVYENVEHGFNCWERPMYNQKASTLARGRTLVFLSSNA